MVTNIVKDYTIQSLAHPIHAAYHRHDNTSILQPAIAMATLSILENGR